MRENAQQRETRLMEMVPDLPADFREWCYSLSFPAPIYYKRHGQYADLTCGKCGAHRTFKTAYGTDYFDETIEVPERHKAGHCYECGHDGAYEWDGVKKPVKESVWVLIFQNIETGVVGRLFEVYKCVQNGAPEIFRVDECIRQFFEYGNYTQYTHCYSYYSGVTYWNKSSSYSGLKVWKITIYPGANNIIKNSPLKYCGIDMERANSFRALDELKAYSNNPAMEMFEKMGLTKIKVQLVALEGINKTVNRHKKDMKGILRLKDKTKIKRLIAKNGSLDMLRLMQLEEKNGWKFTPEQEEWIYKRYADPERIMKVASYSSLQKLINYLDKQKRPFSEYEDYLRMRQELGYDMARSTYIFPKDLHGKHQEMVEEYRKRKDELYITQMMEKYSKITKNFEKENKKLYREHDGLTIRPAKSAEEIIMEGRLQHHCVGGENYLKKHNERTTQILLLRSKPNKPYYTVEIGKDLRIIQFYAAHDKQPDKEKIKAWLDWYVSDLKKHKVKI